MKKIVLFLTLTILLASTVSAADLQPLYRLYHSGANDHFYTMSATEKDNAITSGYKYELITGYMFKTQEPNTVPFYRFLVPGNHIYTTSENEKNILMESSAYTYEGIAGYLYTTQQSNTVPLYRLSTPNNHFYTTSKVEKDQAIASGYNFEGTTGYIYLTQETCTDSDGGNNWYEAGTAENPDGSGALDYCDFTDNPKGILKEAVCENNQPIHKQISCPESTPYCNQGICTTTKPICTDSDGGKNIYVPGMITEPRTVDGPLYGDYCQNMQDKQPLEPCEGDLCGIREFYCTEPYTTTTYADIDCPQGCQDGACIEELDAPIVTEQVTCNFGGAQLIQKCYLATTPDQDLIECSGIESCTLQVTGYEGKEMTWKSSCGGYQTTRMDSANEEIVFDCAQEFACDVKDILNEGETKTYTVNSQNYEVTALIITDTETKLSINGELTGSLIEGKTYILNNYAKVGIVDIIPSTTNQVEFCFLEQTFTCDDSDGGKNFFERGTTYYTIDEHNLASVEICTYELTGPTDGETGDSVIESWCELNQYRVYAQFCEYGCKAGACLESPIDIGAQCGDNICEGGINTGECITCAQDCGPAQCQPLPEQCSGCLKDETCVPIGTRLMDADIPKYCDLSGLTTQKEKGAICMNNYECKTNTCIDEVCYSIKEEIEETRGLIQQILDWIKNVLGIEPRPIECTDTDGGKDYYTKGTASGLMENSEQNTWEDICVKDNQVPQPGMEEGLFEAYCENNVLKIDSGLDKTYICPNGCADGACIEKILPSITPLNRIEVVQQPNGGYFQDSVTGQVFTPRGNNFVRLQNFNNIPYHSTFSPDYYDAAATEQVFYHMQANGYNMVRVFLDPGSWDRFDGINGPWTSEGLSQAYLDNFADFIKKATEHKIYVMPVLELFPFNKYYHDVTNPTDPNLVGYNAYVLHRGHINAKVQYAQDLINGLKSRIGEDLLTTIFAYQLSNELFFDTKLLPFSSTSIQIITADGQTYHMADAAQRQQAADSNSVLFANTLTDAIHTLDSNALVTIGAYTPLAVQKGRPSGLLPIPSADQDSRFPVRISAITKYSKMSFLDLHVYPRTQSLANDLSSAEWELVDFSKPIILGEFGAYKDVYLDINSATTAMKNYQIESCNYNFKGWLFWTFDTWEQSARLWHLSDNGGAINTALAPVARPNPCTG